MKLHRDLTINDLLSRVNFFVDFNSVCDSVAKAYELGKIFSVEPLLVGHSELNTVINTEKGKFVIKFFNKAKEYSVCQSVADALILFSQHDILVPRILQNSNGYLYKLDGIVGQGYLIVMDYFHGQNLYEIKASLEDLCAIAINLAKINTLSTPQPSPYDPWILVYLAQEYDNHKPLLSTEDNNLVQPIVNTFRALDLTQFTQGTVHYDLHRDNLQKGPNGELCIFDMETVGIGYPVVDLASYLGLTCLDRHITLEENQFIINRVLSSYQSIKPLNQYELQALETLTKAIFASNVIAANYLMTAQNDDTQETYKWYELGKESLRVFLDTPLVLPV